MKRLFDCLIATSARMVLAWQVPRKLGGPVLFTQTRPALRGEPFKMVKFSTMTTDRGAAGQLLHDERPLTTFGRWLRATSLDESPEQWKMLKADMSLVGPAPC